MEAAENGCGVSQDVHPLDIDMEEEAHEQGVEPVFRPQEAELVHRQQVSRPSSMFRRPVLLTHSHPSGFNGKNVGRETEAT